jgi:nucleoid-associated protein YgaU
VTDPMQAVLDMTAKASLFPVNSRYHGLDTATLETADGRTVVYLRRRFIPRPDRFTTVLEHTVVQGDRLDNIAAKYIGDPEQFWRICDANGVMDPNELTEAPGSKIRITLPEGIAGVNYG